MAALTPMLARPADVLPVGRDLVYEPKLDGFRALVRTGPAPELRSRRGADLGSAFPEITAAVAHLPPALLDTELVAVGPGGCDFAALCTRVGSRGGHAQELARIAPACLVAFDLLEDGDHDLRGLALRDRRTRLQQFLSGAEGTPAARVIDLVPQTASLTDAQRWMTAGAGAGCEGVVAKRASGTYWPGRRGWVKVRHRHPQEFILAGLTPTHSGPVALVLATHDSGGLRIVGTTLPIRGEAAHQVRRELAPLAIAAPAARGRPEDLRFGEPITAWTPLVPVLVVECLVDGEAFGRIRHHAHLVRFRPDRSPESV